MHKVMKNEQGMNNIVAQKKCYHQLDIVHARTKIALKNKTQLQVFTRPANSSFYTPTAGL